MNGTEFTRPARPFASLDLDRTLARAHVHVHVRGTQSAVVHAQPTSATRPSCAVVYRHRRRGGADRGGT